MADVAPPLPPAALAQRFLRIHERQELMEAENLIAADGARWGMAVRDFGDGLIAQRCAAFPDEGSRNQIAGVTPEAIDRLPEILAWFDEEGCAVSFRFHGADVEPALSARLAALGFVFREIEVWPAARCDGVAPGPDGLDIREATTAEAARTHAETLCEGWGISAAAREPARRAIGAWPAPEGWRRYVGYVDGEPAAEAMLALHGAAAYLAEASTVARFRGRGFQRALVARRAADARAAGFEWIFTMVNWRDQSYANMEAMGLRIAGVTASWRRAPRGDRQARDTRAS